MPNHVINRLEFDCPKERLDEILSAICYDEGSDEAEITGPGTIDFNKITPMPPSLNIESGSRTIDGISLYLTSLNPDVHHFGEDKMEHEAFHAMLAMVGKNYGFMSYNPSMSTEEIAKCTQSTSAEELLEMGKKIWATAGSDRHRLPDISGMTVMYTKTDNSADYMETVRQGNMAPGWVGIRMNVGTTAMGGETDFTGNRLQFSVGDIYNSGQKDYVNTPDPYVAGHTYRVELYDDGGILMTAYIDPTEMNYFAIDCDATAMYYRVVVWDETDNERIGVSNPIWNTAFSN